MTADSLRKYRPWLLAAAVYNLAWGAAVVLLPGFPLIQLGIEPPTVIALWQVVGMMVLVFAPAYWWASRDPWAHRHLVLIGAASRVMGILGFLFAAVTGQLPLSFGLVVLFNDVIWLPVLGAFVFEAAKVTGWRRMLLDGG